MLKISARSVTSAPIYQFFFFFFLAWVSIVSGVLHSFTVMYELNGAWHNTTPRLLPVTFPHSFERALKSTISCIAV